MKKVVLLIVTLTLGLMSQASAEQVTFLSASPYQLGHVLNGKVNLDIKIRATLEFPEKAKGKVGALVFLHGSGGMLYRHKKYLKLARKLGLASFQVDSFTTRGVSSTVGNQTRVTAAMMTMDAHAALKFLAADRRIDASRVFIMGSSKGGTAVLYSAWSPVRKKVLGNLDYAGRIALYPACVDIEDRDVSDKPVAIFIGKEDNWTPANRCTDLTSTMLKAGKQWSIKLYEGAYHGFDGSLSSIRTIPNAYSISECRFALRKDGIEYERTSGFKLDKLERRKALRACAKKGDVKIGGNHALPVLMNDLENFLKQ